jgi:hypothetical protein
MDHKDPDWEIVIVAIEMDDAEKDRIEQIAMNEAIERMHARLKPKPVRIIDVTITKNVSLIIELRKPAKKTVVVVAEAIVAAEMKVLQTIQLMQIPLLN